MKRVCAVCGNVFYTKSNDGILCPACKEQEQKKVVRQRICVDCGRTFDGGPRAKYCPECSVLRKRENLAKHRKNGAARPIGSTDSCLWCGKEYVVRSGRQKYCSDLCSREALLAWQRDHKKKTIDPQKAIKSQNECRAKRQKVCKYCLQKFWSSVSSDLCSDYCRKKQLQINQCEADLRRGYKRNLKKYLDEREKYRASQRKDCI